MLIAEGLAGLLEFLVSCVCCAEISLVVNGRPVVSRVKLKEKLSISVMAAPKSDTLTVFIASSSSDKDKEGIFINHLTKDDSTLAFSQSIHLPDAISPTHIALSHSGQIMYAITESPQEANSRIYAWKLMDENGQQLETPLRTGSWPIGGTGACQIVVHQNDRFIYVVNYDSGSLSAFKDVSKLGDLVRCNMFRFAGGSWVVPDKQDSAHIRSIVIIPGDKFIYLTDTGSDCVWKTGYSILHGFEFITELPEPFPAPLGCGPGPAVMAIRDDGPFLYIGCQFTNHLLVYWIDEDTFGNLEQTQYFPVIPLEMADQQGDQGVTDIQISTDTLFLYMATHVRNAISVLGIDKEGNANFIQWVECGGQVPRCILLVPQWSVILVGNQKSKDLTAFLIEKENGKIGESVMINGQKRLELGYEPTQLVLKIADDFL